jgi:hypothetical protein
MNRLKGIKRLANYGLITLVGFNLFIGCEDSNHIEPIEFVLESNLTEDSNGFYHLEIDTSVWQTLHRISGGVYRNGESVDVIKFGWYSSHHWIIGDEFGYVIANNGLTDDMTYVGYDTTYITWFTGWEVPIVNGASYSNSDGEVNTMMAPIKTMVGDTAAIQYSFYDDWRGEETNGVFYVIFD